MKIPKLTIETTNCRTELCYLGQKHRTDKSPLNPLKYKHAYTPIYSSWFAPFRNKSIHIGELGIALGAGLNMLRDYFPNAHLYGFDKVDNHLESCRNLNLNKTSIIKTDAGFKEVLNATFSEHKCQFDILIDDGSHLLQQQLNLLEIGFKYMKPGGILIVEDIYCDQNRSPDSAFEETLAPYSDQIAFSAFVYPQDDDAFVGEYNNEKLLYVVKR